MTTRCHTTPSSTQDTVASVSHKVPRTSDKTHFITDIWRILSVIKCVVSLVRGTLWNTKATVSCVEEGIVWHLVVTPLCNNCRFESHLIIWQHYWYFMPEGKSTEREMKKNYKTESNSGTPPSLLRILVFLDVTLSSGVNRYQRFERAWCLRLQGLGGHRRVPSKLPEVLTPLLTVRSQKIRTVNTNCRLKLKSR